jgi:predicted ATPase
MQEGLAEMEAGLAGLRQAGEGLYLQFFIALLAQSYAKLCRRDDALAMLEQVLTTIEHTGETLHKADILRLQGEVLLMADKPDVAQCTDQIRAAIDVARLQKAKWWELRATMSVARLLANESGGDEARAALADIYRPFGGGFDLPDLMDAKVLLDELNRAVEPRE